MSVGTALQHAYACDGRQISLSAELLPARDPRAVERNLPPEIHALLAQAQLIGMSQSMDALVSVGGLVKAVRSLSTGLRAALMAVPRDKPLSTDRQEALRGQIDRLARRIETMKRGAAKTPALAAGLRTSLRLLAALKARLPRMQGTGQVVKHATLRRDGTRAAIRHMAARRGVGPSAATRSPSMRAAQASRAGRVAADRTVARSAGVAPSAPATVTRLMPRGGAVAMARIAPTASVQSVPVASVAVRSSAAAVLFRQAVGESLPRMAAVPASASVVSASPVARVVAEMPTLGAPGVKAAQPTVPTVFATETTKVTPVQIGVATRQAATPMSEVRTLATTSAPAMPVVTVKGPVTVVPATPVPVIGPVIGAATRAAPVSTVVASVARPAVVMSADAPVIKVAPGPTAPPPAEAQANAPATVEKKSATAPATPEPPVAAMPPGEATPIATGPVSVATVETVPTQTPAPPPPTVPERVPDPSVTGPDSRPTAFIAEGPPVTIDGKEFVTQVRTVWCPDCGPEGGPVVEVITAQEQIAMQGATAELDTRLAALYGQIRLGEDLRDTAQQVTAGGEGASARHTSQPTSSPDPSRVTTVAQSADGAFSIQQVGGDGAAGGKRRSARIRIPPAAPNHS